MRSFIHYIFLNYRCLRNIMLGYVVSKILDRMDWLIIYYSTSATKCQKSSCCECTQVQVTGIRLGLCQNSHIVIINITMTMKRTGNLQLTDHSWEGIHRQFEQLSFVLHGLFWCMQRLLSPIHKGDPGSTLKTMVKIQISTVNRVYL